MGTRSHTCRLTYHHPAGEPGKAAFRFHPPPHATDQRGLMQHARILALEVLRANALPEDALVLVGVAPSSARDLRELHEVS